MKPFFNHLDIRYWAFIFSIILSFICLSQIDVINNDGILYLRTAEVFENGHWALAHQLYPWPFYSFIIYLTHTITLLSYEYSAYLLNTLFFAIATACFVDIAQQLSFEKKYVWFSLLLFLMFPLLNDYRNFIIRDAGFLAFYLLSLRSLLIYTYEENSKNYTYLWLWIFYMILATFFRIEGFIYLFASPLILLFVEKNSRERFKIVIFFAVPIFILFIFLGLLTYFHPDYFLKNIERIQEVYEKILTSYSAINESFYKKIPIIQNQILNIYSQSYSTFFLAAGITCYYFAESIRALHPLYLILVGTGSLRGKAYFKKQTLHVLLSYILISFLMTYLFTLQYFFLSERYLLPMAVTTLFFAIPSLKCIEEKFSRLKNFHLLFFKGLLFIIILYLFLDGITHFGYSKIYIKEAALWVKQNFSAKEKIYCNSRQIMYEAHIYPQGWEQFRENLTNIQLLEKQKFLLSFYDSLILEIPKKDQKEAQTILNSFTFHLHKNFQNKRGDAVYIYSKNF